MNINKKQRIKIYDLTKYILSLMIIAIHSDLQLDFLYPWLRIAVPLFFIISSYFLFSSINNNPDKEKDILKKYIKRNILFYTFWFIVLSPLTIYRRRVWFYNGIVRGILITIQNIVFSSSFTTSWYIVASIWAALFLYATRNIKKIVMIPIVLTIYVLCCIYSSYWSLIPQNYFLKCFMDNYILIFTNPIASFPIGIVWMYVGKFFAEHRSIIVSTTKNIVTNILLLSISMLCLFLEWKYVCAINKKVSMDLLMMLMPVSIFLFIFLLHFEKYEFKIKTDFICVESVVSFPLHSAIIKVITHFEPQSVTTKDRLLCFVITVALCHLVSYVIYKIENKRNLLFLKYSH